MERSHQRLNGAYVFDSTRAMRSMPRSPAPMRISHVIKGVRPVTAELALLFGRALGQAPHYWLNLQAAYDLKMAERAMDGRLRSVTELAPA